MTQHIATVGAIYEAFGKGDISFILSCLAEDVEWDNRDDHGIPLLVPRKGRAEVGLFFQEMMNLEMQDFSVDKLYDGGSSVLAWARVSWIWKPSGKVFSDPFEFHLWEFNPDGKVSRFLHLVDTHAMWLATTAPAG